MNDASVVDSVLDCVLDFGELELVKLVFKGELLVCCGKAGDLSVESLHGGLESLDFIMELERNIAELDEIAKFDNYAVALDYRLDFFDFLDGVLLVVDDVA